MARFRIYIILKYNDPENILIWNMLFIKVMNEMRPGQLII